MWEKSCYCDQLYKSNNIYAIRRGLNHFLSSEFRVNSFTDFEASTYTYQNLKNSNPSSVPIRHVREKVFFITHCAIRIRFKGFHIYSLQKGQRNWDIYRGRIHIILIEKRMNTLSWKCLDSGQCYKHSFITSCSYFNWRQSFHSFIICKISVIISAKRASRGRI